MHKDYYCAYHHTQIITSFCRCPQCLLPACSACHSINKTQAQYESMTTIFKEVMSTIADTEKKSKSLAKSLSFIQKNRKQEMNDLREAITKKGKELIDIFKASLKQLDQQIVSLINEMDTNFIDQIETIDDKIIKLERDIEKQRCGIQSEDSLKTMISFFQSQKERQFNQRLVNLNETVSRFGRKKIFVKFISDFKVKVDLILKDFISVAQRESEN